MLRFHDRREAGRLLSGLLRDAVSSGDVVVIALSKNGLPVADEVAIALRAPLHLLERDELCSFRTEIVPRRRTPMGLRGRTVILTDDAFGDASRLKEAASELRREGPARIIAAAPVALLGVGDDVGEVIDRVVALAAPRPFRSAAFWYDDSPLRPIGLPVRATPRRGFAGVLPVC
jgi:putative phosphoribosyl transferase